MPVQLLKLDEVLGLKLIEVESTKGVYTDDPNELVLHFENGKELLIWTNEEILTVEGD